MNNHVYGYNKLPGEVQLQKDFPVLITQASAATDDFGVEGVLPGDRLAEVRV